MTQPKFKVGDRVRRVNNPTPWAPLGFEVIVSCEGWYKNKNGNPTKMVEDMWELVDPLEEAKKQLEATGYTVTPPKRAEQLREIGAHP